MNIATTQNKFLCEYNIYSLSEEFHSIYWLRASDADLRHGNNRSRFVDTGA